MIPVIVIILVDSGDELQPVMNSVKAAKDSRLDLCLCVRADLSCTWPWAHESARARKQARTCLFCVCHR